MAKKKSKRKKYTTAGRVDMRNGGRVAMRTGANPQMATDERITKRTYGPNPLEGSQEQTIPKLITTPSPRPPAPGPAPQISLPPRVGDRPIRGDVFPDIPGRNITYANPADVAQIQPQTQIAGEPEQISTTPNFMTMTPEEREAFLESAKTNAQQNQANFTYAQPDYIGEDFEMPAQDDLVKAARENIKRQQQANANPYNIPPNIWAGMTDDQKQAIANQQSGQTSEQTTDSDALETFESERRQRMIEAGRQAEAIARGEIPEGAVPTTDVVPIEMGEQYETEALQIAKRKGVTPEYVREVGIENVRQMEDVSTVKTPEPITASKIQADQIDKTPEILAAEGAIKNEALAKAANVDRVQPVEGAEVEIIPGALTERVVGVLSEEAKAQAAQNAGTSLARVTRAKTQLRNAGLNEEQIEAIGNDPEDLEARLMDLTEEERGIIEGLPKEALVSTQLNSLLAGIEDGQIPTWAAPAVAQVEQMLAQRGMSASTVGRDALLNAIIQSAIPLAQSNAQAIQSSVAQQKNIEAQAELQNTQFRQQTALQNAQSVFQMNLAQFSADQQTALSNSKFLQTVGITEANLDQQATLQNAMLLSQANLAEADFYQKAQIQNAQAFLTMDMQNLNNQQQTNVLKAQQEQQRLLSNQAATNAARQFNAASENQTQQFMASLNTQINQFNSQQMNAAQQFNVQQQNAAEARRIQNTLEVNKANAAIVNQTRQFNEQIDFNRQQFNVQNAQAIEQSNVEWRRKANLANTAAQNTINQENAKMAFSLTSQAQSFLWQELRDQADYDFRWVNDTANRKVQAMIAAASAEGDIAKNWQSNFNNISSVIDKVFGI